MCESKHIIACACHVRTRPLRKSSLPLFFPLLYFLFCFPFFFLIFFIVLRGRCASCLHLWIFFLIFVLFFLCFNLQASGRSMRRCYRPPTHHSRCSCPKHTWKHCARSMPISCPLLTHTARNSRRGILFLTFFLTV